MAWAASKARQAERKALGLKWFGGRPSKLWKRLDQKKREDVLAMADALIEVMPAGPVDRPVEQWTHAELLSDGARTGLIRVREIAGWPVRDDPHPDEIKRSRLIMDAGATLFKTLKDIQSAALAAAGEDKTMSELLADIARERAKRHKS